MPNLNVEYVGTYSNAFSSTTVWNTPSVATWASVAQWDTANQTFTLNTSTLTSGSIDITGSSLQYAIFRLALADRNYVEATSRNYTFSNTATDYDFTAIPEPTTWALLAGSLTTLMVFRRRRA